MLSDPFSLLPRSFLQTPSPPLYGLDSTDGSHLFPLHMAPSGFPLCGPPSRSPCFLVDKYVFFLSSFSLFYCVCVVGFRAHLFCLTSTFRWPPAGDPMRPLPQYADLSVFPRRTPLTFPDHIPTTPCNIDQNFLISSFLLSGPLTPRGLFVFACTGSR